MADIFISDAREDLQRVETLSDALWHRGWSVWWDSRLSAGKFFHKEIDKQIADARCVLVVWTASPVTSDWVYAEAMEALNQKKLVPCFLDQVKPPLLFRHVHAVDLRGWRKGADGPEFDLLIHDISALAGPPGASHPGPEAPGPGRSPDRGQEEAAREPFSRFRDRLAEGSEGPEMIWIPPGSFLMGSPGGDEMAETEEKPQHQVRITRPFAIGRYPVTFSEGICIPSARKSRIRGGFMMSTAM